MKEILSIVGQDDAWMVAEGIWPPKAFRRDSNAWSKTPEERKLLKIYKGYNYYLARSGNGPRKHIPIYMDLSVQVKGYPKTTYKFKCWQGDIPNVLSKFDNKVIKYFWNGRTYQPNELPFWPN